MPKSAGAPRLVLYGPDDKHGASPRKGFRSYIWYLVWHEGKNKREKSTGAKLHERVEAEEKLGDHLAHRRAQRADAPAGGYRPHQVDVSWILERYCTEEAIKKISAPRIGYAVDALLPFWKDRLLSEVGKPSCEAYVKWRMRQPTRNALQAIAAWERKQAQTKANGRPFAAPKPAMTTVVDRTARTELEYLRAAIKYCHDMLYITQEQPVSLPEKGLTRQTALTRSEFARLLLAARAAVLGKPFARRHLIVYLKVGIYQPARKQAILGLPLVQPIDGGAWLDAKRGTIDFGPGNGKKLRPRGVPIHGRILVYVRAAKRRGQRYLIEQATRVYEDDGRPTGAESRRIGDVRHSFANCVARAGLAKRVTPHTLRHTGVSWLKDRGMDSKKVGDFAGMTSETVDTIYTHLDPAALADVASALTSGRRKA